MRRPVEMVGKEAAQQAAIRCKSSRDDLPTI